MLDEGRVMITFSPQLSSSSLHDLKQYPDIFYREACRLTDDPVDFVAVEHFARKTISLTAE